MKMRAFGQILLLATLGASAFNCGGGGSANDDTSVVSQSSPLNQRTVDRTIPLRIIVLETSSTSACNPGQAAFDQAVKGANDVWIAAGVQFFISEIQVVVAPAFGSLAGGARHRSDHLAN